MKSLLATRPVGLVQRSLFLVGVVLLISSCDTMSQLIGKTGGGTAAVPVTGVSVSYTPQILEIGNAQYFTAVVSPSNATNRNVNWSSSDPICATVDASGMVTGVNTGTTTITARTADGGLTSSGSVTVGPDATLLYLRLDGYALNETFAPGRTQYSASVPNSVSNVTIQASPHSNSSVITSGTGLQTLVVGTNLFNMVVTASDSRTTRTYTLSITRAAAVVVPTSSSVTGTVTLPRAVSGRPYFIQIISGSGPVAQSTGFVNASSFTYTIPSVPSGNYGIQVMVDISGFSTTPGGQLNPSIDFMGSSSVVVPASGTVVCDLSVFNMP